MKIKSAVLTLTFISALVLPFSLYAISLVKADGYGSWDPIKTPGYAVITNYFGTNVTLDQNVSATAGTTDMSVYQIEFRWHNASDVVIFDDIVKVSGPLTTPTVPANVPQQVTSWANDNPGVTYLFAQDTQTPNSTGDWGVQALFYASGGHLQGQGSDIVEIKAVSFTPIPENPAIGTVGAAIALLLALGLHRKQKRKQKQIS